MNLWSRFMNYLFLVALLFLSGCSNLPPAIEDPPAFDLAYLQAVTEINKFKNAAVRWGGKIVEVENQPTFSAIQILVYPLGSYGRPELDEAHQGRFVVKSPDFLDPAVYTKDTPITVAGTLMGDTERTIGNKTMRLPLVQANTIHLWQTEDYNRYYGGYGGFGYGYGGFYPYGGFYGYPYWGGYYTPYHRPWHHR
jgi:outer membrane lipoprotein